MKKTIQLFALLILTLAGMQQQSFACGINAGIAGPTGRCTVAAGVPTTYTGFHNFGSSGCTFYEWTITGGTIISPLGTLVSNGTLILTENTSCAFIISAELGNSSTVVEVDPAVLDGPPAANITVIWDSDVVGTLSLQVTELGTIRRSSSAFIEVDTRIANLSSISRLLGTTAFSGSYQANFNLPPCEIVQWTVNGINAGTGNPITLPVGYCTTAQICATTPTNPNDPTCRNFDGGSLIASVSGPSSAPVGADVTFSLNINQPTTSIQWSTQPSNAISLLFPTDAESVFGFVNGNPGSNVFVCADVETVCGEVFEKCRKMEILSSINGESVVDPKQGQVVEMRDALVDEQNMEELKFKIYPTVINQQQALHLELPVLKTAASVVVLDMQGNLVQEQTIADQFAQIATREMPSGMYIVQVRSGEWMASEKFIVR